MAEYIAYGGGEHQGPIKDTLSTIPHFSKVPRPPDKTTQGTKPYVTRTEGHSRKPESKSSQLGMNRSTSYPGLRGKRYKGQKGKKEYSTQYIVFTQTTGGLVLQKLICRKRSRDKETQSQVKKIDGRHGHGVSNK